MAALEYEAGRLAERATTLPPQKSIELQHLAAGYRAGAQRIQEIPAALVQTSL
jgi:hypothetical protein